MAQLKANRSLHLKSMYRNMPTYFSNFTIVMVEVVNKRSSSFSCLFSIEKKIPAELILHRHTCKHWLKYKRDIYLSWYGSHIECLDISCTLQHHLCNNDHTMTEVGLYRFYVVSSDQSHRGRNSLPIVPINSKLHALSRQNKMSWE